tara:strand:- start:4812 stop:6650 length:1839 start_codon:yes stop_codon:yes gene_type:complete
MNSRFYKSLTGIILFSLLYSCSNEESEAIITYDISPTVDPNTSLDCTGVWANSPLCKERNEALVELKILDPLYQSFKQVDNNQAKDILSEVESLKKEGDKFYFEEFYFKSRDSYKKASELINGFNDRNRLKVLELIDRAQSAFDLIKLNEADTLIQEGLSIDPANSKLLNLNNRIINYQTVTDLISSAKDYSSSNQYSLALQTIDEAIQVDPERVDAKQTKNIILEESKIYYFDQNLKNAYKALTANEFTKSLTLYNDAKSILPNSQELPILKREIDTKKKSYDIVLFSNSGDNSYVAENWESALDAYSKALKLDPTNSDLIKKANRTSSVKKTYDDLNKYLRNIDRLSSPNIRNNFEKVLKVANNLNLKDEKQLINLISKANETFETYGKMVVLNLISNDETYLDIQKTRQYEPFVEENIKLYPGKYVLVAKKRGMQSTRKEINLEPGTEFLSITAKCTNKCSIYETGNVSKDDVDLSNVEEQQESIVNNQQANTMQNITNEKFIKNAKIVSSSFSKNIQCTKTTRNSPLRLTFTLNVDKAGKVVSSRVTSIRVHQEMQQAKNLKPDDRAVIVIIEKALKKSKFNVPKLNGQPQVGKINHVVVVPAGFCVA